MEGHPSHPAERVPAIQEYFAQWTPRIHPVKAPEEEFQERFQRAQDLFNGLINSQQDSFKDKVKEILRCGTHVQELMAEHEATKEDKERAHKQALCDQQTTLVFDLLDLFGPELGKELCKMWCERVAQSSSTTTIQSDSIPDTQRVDQTTSSHFAPIQEKPTGTHEPPTQNTNGSIPSPPNTESAGEPSTRPNNDQTDKAEQDTLAGHQKRPASPTVARSSRPAKRPRTDTSQGPLTGNRTIEFDQVYQDGQAEPKYVIVKHNRFWYILECKKHRLHFNNHPIRGAAKHLRGKKHARPCVNYEEAIRALGTRVLHCDEDKANENNAVARRPSYSQMGRPNASVSPYPHSLHTRSNRSPTGIDPQPGEVYTTFWNETKQFFTILVLPWHNCGQLGKDLSLTVKDTVLIKKVPSCYKQNAAGEFEWDPEYRPGGRNYSKRRYPIMYFDAPVFPGECRVNWVAVRDIQHYNPLDTTMPFKEIVDGFIISRSNNHGVTDEAEPDGGHGHEGDLNDDPPTAEVFPREDPCREAPGREVIVIDDSGDEFADYAWPDTPEWSGDPVPKIEDQDEPRVMGDDQPDTNASYANELSQQPVGTEVVNQGSQGHTEVSAESHVNLIGPTEFLRRLDNANHPGSDLPNHDQAPLGDGTPEFYGPSRHDAVQPQNSTDVPMPQWPPGEENEPGNTLDTNFHSHQHPPATNQDTRPPEAIMTPLPPNHNHNPPSNSDMSQRPPNLQTTELYSYLNQARRASTQFRLGSDGRLQWLAPETLYSRSPQTSQQAPHAKAAPASAKPRSQKPTSAREQEQRIAQGCALRDLYRPGQDSQPVVQQAPVASQQRQLAPRPPGQ